MLRFRRRGIAEGFIGQPAFMHVRSNRPPSKKKNTPTMRVAELLSDLTSLRACVGAPDSAVVDR
jgi:hypothetical protein